MLDFEDRDKTILIHLRSGGGCGQGDRPEDITSNQGVEMLWEEAVIFATANTYQPGALLNFTAILAAVIIVVQNRGTEFT